MTDHIESRDAAPKPNFSQDVMEKLFYWARDRVVAVVSGGETPDRSLLGAEGDAKVLGAFVSFKIRGRLRSCMGCMSEGIALSDALDSAAVWAATRDPRFAPISASEFYDLDLEIWALGAMREVREKGDARRDAFLIGRDGLQIRGRGRQGLLLPSVPVELGWNADEFLDGLCDKAGLARGAWRQDDVQLFAFEGVSFKKPFVWNAGRNPLLAQILEKRRTEETSASRASFSFVPSFFQWNAPNRRRDDPQGMRPAAVAGMFYPRTHGERAEMLDAFLKTASLPDVKEQVDAALAPHAGWIYSGRLALETLARVEAPETIVVFAPKHRREGANLSVSPCASWDFGGERLESNVEFADAMTSATPEFQKDPLAHQSEHSIEVLLPILARLFPNVKIVGALIGAATREELKSLAERFAEFLGNWEKEGRKRPLLLISSDMNHYADEETTQILDGLALDAIQTLEPDNLLTTVRDNRISMCGVLPAYFVLTALKAQDRLKRSIIVGHTTSAEASGDRERVVGYAGCLFGR